MKNKEEKFSLSNKATLPYLQFPDLQAYADSLSLKELQEWDVKLSKKDSVHPDVIVVAMAIYSNELRSEMLELTESEVMELCNNFTVSMSLFHNIRTGTLKMTSGRLTLVNATAKFEITDQGIRSVESLLKRK